MAQVDIGPIHFIYIFFVFVFGLAEKEKSYIMDSGPWEIKIILFFINYTIIVKFFLELYNNCKIIVNDKN